VSLIGWWTPKRETRCTTCETVYDTAAFRQPSRCTTTLFEY